MYPPAQEYESRYTKGVDHLPDAIPASGFPNTATHPKPSVPYMANSGSGGVHTPRGIAGGTVVAGQWSTNLCHCCDDPANCMITCFCPCITFGQIAEIVDQGNSRTSRCSGCAAKGTMYGLLAMTGFACLYSCFYRSKLRGQYDLEESPCVDCLVHFCCEACALCQEYREFKKRGFDMGIGWQANMDRRQRAGFMVPPAVGHGMTR